MTTTDRADAIVKKIQQRVHAELENFLFDIERAITAAVEAERESNRQFAQEVAEAQRAYGNTDGVFAAELIEKTIRARGADKEKE